MFRRDLDNAAYERVLDNPRVHTGQGYQTKAAYNKNNSCGNSHGSYFNSYNSQPNYDDYY